MNIQIQVNGKRPNESQRKLSAHIDATVKRSTSHFRDRISSVDVFLQDEKTATVSEKRCVLEAHIEGRLPIVATYNSESFNHSVEGASATLKATLEKDLGHHKQH